MPAFAKAGTFAVPEGAVPAQSPIPGRAAFMIGSGRYRMMSR